MWQAFNKAVFPRGILPVITYSEARSIWPYKSHNIHSVKKQEGLKSGRRKNMLRYRREKLTEKMKRLTLPSLLYCNSVTYDDA